MQGQFCLRHFELQEGPQVRQGDQVTGTEEVFWVYVDEGLDDGAEGSVEFGVRQAASHQQLGLSFGWNFPKALHGGLPEQWQEDHPQLCQVGSPGSDMCG